jgi:hypothetical protein
MRLFSLILFFTLYINTLLGVSPTHNIIIDRVDTIELNHFYDENGRLVFDQYVFWQNNRVRDWVLAKNCRQIPNEGELRIFDANFIPPFIGDPKIQFDYINKFVVLDIDGLIYRVHYTSYTESWTQHDVETADREFLAKEDRKSIRIDMNEKWNEEKKKYINQNMIK